MSEDIVPLIQLAIAPVFLLTAIAATLSVLAARIARIIDRGRFLEASFAAPIIVPLQVELGKLQKRARIIYWAMTLATVSAIQITLLIASSFIGHVIGLDLSWLMATLFLGAIFCYTGALICLLREVAVAIVTFQVGSPGTELEFAL